MISSEQIGSHSKCLRRFVADDFGAQRPNYAVYPLAAPHPGLLGASTTVPFCNTPLRSSKPNSSKDSPNMSQDCLSISLMWRPNSTMSLPFSSVNSTRPTNGSPLSGRLLAPSFGSLRPFTSESLSNIPTSTCDASTPFLRQSQNDFASEVISDASPFTFPRFILTAFFEKSSGDATSYTTRTPNRFKSTPCQKKSTASQIRSASNTRTFPAQNYRERLNTKDIISPRRTTSLSRSSALASKFIDSANLTRSMAFREPSHRTGNHAISESVAERLSRRRPYISSSVETTNTNLCPRKPVVHKQPGVGDVRESRHVKTGNWSNDAMRYKKLSGPSNGREAHVFDNATKAISPDGVAAKAQGLTFTRTIKSFLRCDLTDSVNHNTAYSLVAYDIGYTKPNFTKSHSTKTGNKDKQGVKLLRKSAKKGFGDSSDRQLSETGTEAAAMYVNQTSNPNLLSARYLRQSSVASEPTMRWKAPGEALKTTENDSKDPKEHKAAFSKLGLPPVFEIHSEEQHQKGSDAPPVLAVQTSPDKDKEVCISDCDKDGGEASRLGAVEAVQLRSLSPILSAQQEPHEGLRRSLLPKQPRSIADREFQGSHNDVGNRRVPRRCFIGKLLLGHTPILSRLRTDRASDIARLHSPPNGGPHTALKSSSGIQAPAKMTLSSLPAVSHRRFMPPVARILHPTHATKQRCSTPSQVSLNSVVSARSHMKSAPAPKGISSPGLSVLSPSRYKRHSIVSERGGAVAEFQVRLTTPRQPTPPTVDHEWSPFRDASKMGPLASRYGVANVSMSTIAKTTKRQRSSDTGNTSAASTAPPILVSPTRLLFQRQATARASVSSLTDTATATNTADSIAAAAFLQSCVSLSSSRSTQSINSKIPQRLNDTSRDDCPSACTYFVAATTEDTFVPLQGNSHKTVPSNSAVGRGSTDAIGAVTSTSAVRGTMVLESMVLKMRQLIFQTPDISPDDFDRGATVGTGTFGRVQLARLKGCPDTAPLALKVMKKSNILRLHQVEHVRAEIAILQCIDHPFIVNLLGNFQDESCLYMIMEFVRGGELFSYLRRVQKLALYEAVFYASEIVLAFEYLHERKIAYRDLKPENLLLDGEGHIKITDFGFAKVVEDRTWTLCGTPEYLAPEVLQSRGHNSAADWWSLGILIYEMLCGFPPFYDETPFRIYKKILAGHIEFPSFIDQNSKHLIRRLLSHDISQRFGCLKGGAEDVKAHKFFKNVDWDKCIKKLIKPVYVPVLTSPCDTSHFDTYPESTGEEDFELTESDAGVFDDF